ncbi:RNA polymerase sigma-70 factor (family 1) [Pedobacter africanus]|uniref:RNA polymerase sigma-70 factor (ECF subfamily) n=1 Tax=Pedobacter africanus TaxID=151894 RepID=A0ACC6L0S0_9SPHI|nr:RNA polymerase sigma-70 factor [Pedobacter africanus]MDR6785233.1 RNA polymerase sigma-70 factor (ECF subfamily) [Pedobacter africanus]
MIKPLTRNEAELVLLLQQGDMDALSGLYFLHVKQLKRYIIKGAKSPALTEDIIHDTFIKVWENRAGIDSSQSFKAYLYTIARRHLLNLMKRAQFEDGIVNEIKKYSAEADRSTELLLEYNESNSLLNEAVQHLPPQCKEIFIRCKINGQSHKQIAEELHISMSTVNNQMGKALKNIKEFLTEHNGFLLILAAIMK